MKHFKEHWTSYFCISGIIILIIILASLYYKEKCNEVEYYKNKYNEVQFKIDFPIKKIEMNEFVQKCKELTNVALNISNFGMDLNSFLKIRNELFFLTKDNEKLNNYRVKLIMSQIERAAVYSLWLENEFLDNSTHRNNMIKNERFKVLYELRSTIETIQQELKNE